MVEQFGNEEQQCYCGDVNANGIPVEDEEYAALHPLYKPIFGIVTTKLSEPAVKYAAKEHGISYNPLDEDNSQKYLFQWKFGEYPKLQRKVAKYFAEQEDDINQLSPYYIDGDEEEEVEAEVEVEDDEFDDELERYAPKDDALVEDVDGLTSTVQFKPIEKLHLNQEQLIGSDDNDESTNEDNGATFNSCCDGGFDTDSQESNIPELSSTTFVGGKDVLDTSYLKQGINQSTVGNALNAPKLGREEDCNTFKGE